MSIQKLEELEVWQEARILMKMAYKLTTKFSQFKNSGFNHGLPQIIVHGLPRIKIIGGHPLKIRGHPRLKRSKLTLF